MTGTKSQYENKKNCVTGSLIVTPQLSLNAINGAFSVKKDRTVFFLVVSDLICCNLTCDWLELLVQSRVKGGVMAWVRGLGSLEHKFSPFNY